MHGGHQNANPPPRGPRGFQNQKSPTPGPPGDSAHQISHPLGDGGFQNSIIYQAKFCTDYYPINPLYLILPLEYLFSWVKRADQPFRLPTCQIVGDFCVKKKISGDFHRVHRHTKVPKSPIKPRGLFGKIPHHGAFSNSIPQPLRGGEWGPMGAPLSPTPGCKH